MSGVLDTPLWVNPRRDSYFAEAPTLGQYVDNKLEENISSGMNSSVFHDWLLPADKEARQFAMQLKMAENEPAAKMKGMIEAGINPLTAAAGIAGSSTGNIPSPSSSTNPIGDIADAVGSVSSGYGAIASGVKSLAEAEQVKPLATSTIEKNNAEIEKWSHDNGFTDVQAQAFEIDNQTRDEMNRAGLNVKRQQYRTMVEQAEHIRKQKEFVSKQIQWYDEQIEAEIDLTNKRSLEAEKHAFLMEEQTRTEKMENDFAEKFKYRRDQPFDSAMLSLWFEGEFDKVQQAQDFMYNLKYGMSYNQAKGEFDADSETAYDRAHKKAKGEYEADPFQQQYREIYDMIDQVSDQEKETSDLLLSLKDALDKGLISQDEYNFHSAKLQALLRDEQKSVRELNKLFSKQSYAAGHASQLQEIKGDLIKIGVGVGLLKATNSPQTVVKGFRP